MPEISSDKILASTSADKLLVKLKQCNYCDEAKTFYTQFAGRTVGEMVEGTLDQSWAYWYLRVFGRKNDIGLRKKMIAHIKDSMRAFQLYLKLPWLTDEEDRLLEAKFKGRLPNAEKQLAQGIVKRMKV